MTIHAALLLAAATVAGCERAAAECGSVSAYTQQTRANRDASNSVDISAAHKSLPLGTRVIVRNQRTGRSIIVRIVDHSPFSLERIIDLSAGAMNALGLSALAPVCLEVVSYGSASHGYGKLAARNPAATVKHAVIRQHVHIASAARSKRVRGGEKTASVRSHAGKRYAQLHRQSKRSGRRRQSGRG